MEKLHFLHSPTNLPTHNYKIHLNFQINRYSRTKKNLKSQTQSFNRNFQNPKKRKMDFRLMNLDSPIFLNLHNMMELADQEASANKSGNAPTMTYVRDATAMAATPTDVKEYANSYVFVVDMPGCKSGDVKVQVEEDNLLLISGERKKEEEKEEVKYLKMERRIGKLLRKFLLPDDANRDTISAVYQDGVLTVTVEKLRPPEPKKPKLIEVKIA